MNPPESTELHDRLTAAAHTFVAPDGLRDVTARRVERRRTRAIVATGLCSVLAVVGIASAAVYAASDAGISRRTVAPATRPTPAPVTTTPATAPAVTTAVPPAPTTLPARTTPTVRVVALTVEDPAQAWHLTNPLYQSVTVDVPYLRLDGLDAGVVEKVNAALKAPADAAVTDFEQYLVQLDKDANAQGFTNCEGCPATNQLVADDSQPTAALPGTAAGPAVTVSLLTPDYASVRYSYQTDTAGEGHGSTSFRGVTVDLRTGEVVDPAALVATTADQSALTAAVVSAFQTRMYPAAPPDEYSNFTMLTKAFPAGWPFITSGTTKIGTPGVVVTVSPDGFVVSADPGIIDSMNGGYRGPGATVPWAGIPLSPLGNAIARR